MFIPEFQHFLMETTVLRRNYKQVSEPPQTYSGMKPGLLFNPHMLRLHSETRSVLVQVSQ